MFRFLIDRLKRKANVKNGNESLKKAVVKEEPDAYVWSIFTLEGVSYFTLKEIIEEEANIMVLEDKNAFFVKTVHVDHAAADAAHEMLRKKSRKINKATLTEFMTNQVDINNNKIKRLPMIARTMHP